VAGKKERQRKLARQRFERQQARRVERQRRSRRLAYSGLAALAVIGVAIGSVAAAGVFGTGSKSGAGSSPAASRSASPPASPAATPAAPASEPAHRCDYLSHGVAARKVGMPPAKPDYKASYTATIKTNRGDIVIKLLNRKATCTVNSFVYLAAKKYFNATPCHRLTTSGIYVLQCGDPTGTGSGGPGYEFANENLAGAKYTSGTVAMANSGPNTNGSQFFLVYRDSPALPASYTPFGTITSGLNIIRKVAKAGSDNSNGPGDGHPKMKVTIESVQISKT
jgi:peptidyl-prolyl cis-trans isomerase B (cyclophilin B)